MFYKVDAFVFLIWLLLLLLRELNDVGCDRSQTRIAHCVVVG